MSLSTQVFASFITDVTVRNVPSSSLSEVPNTLIFAPICSSNHSNRLPHGGSTIKEDSLEARVLCWRNPRP